MQFAERWIGLGSLVIAFAATGFVARPKPLPHHDRVAPHVDFRRTNCHGAAAMEPIRIEPSVDQILIEGHEADPYTPVFESADLADCFGDETRIEMLVDIAADGHVTRVTHRPERPNRASRCIAHAVRRLQFPANDSAVSIRYAFTK
ncbi:MAG TPA: hypothetical protein VFQ65_06630 [Kofleriaceae bacterium]|nr:hypothetical protein [Kofleriaceae bacterium]